MKSRYHCKNIKNTSLTGGSKLREAVEVGSNRQACVLGGCLLGVGEVARHGPVQGRRVLGEKPNEH